jgi:hypothetical protein
LYVNQTCEKLGLGWAMWFIDGEKKFNANFPILWADAVAKGWSWTKDAVSSLNINYSENTKSVTVY